MPVSGVACTLAYVAWNNSTNGPQTGDAANHAVRVLKDGTEITPAATPAEVDATHFPGVYTIAIAAGEAPTYLGIVGGTSSTASVSLLPAFYHFFFMPSAVAGAANGMPLL